MREFSMVYLLANEVTPLSRKDAEELATHYRKALPAPGNIVSLCSGYSLYAHKESR